MALSPKKAKDCNKDCVRVEGWGEDSNAGSFGLFLVKIKQKLPRGGNKTSNWTRQDLARQTRAGHPRYIQRSGTGLQPQGE